MNITQFFIKIRNLMSFLVITSQSGLCAQSSSLYAFDNPYPVNSFQQVLECGAQTWHLLNTMQKIHVECQQYELMTDALLGCSMRFQDAVYRLLDDYQKGTKPLIIEDCCYVHMLVEESMNMQKNLALQADADRLMKKLLSETGMQLERIITPPMPVGE